MESLTASGGPSPIPNRFILNEGFNTNLTNGVALKGGGGQDRVSLNLPSMAAWLLEQSGTTSAAIQFNSDALAQLRQCRYSRANRCYDEQLVQ